MGRLREIGFDVEEFLRIWGSRVARTLSPRRIHRNLVNDARIRLSDPDRLERERAGFWGQRPEWEQPGIHGLPTQPLLDKEKKKREENKIWD